MNLVACRLRCGYVMPEVGNECNFQLSLLLLLFHLLLLLPPSPTLPPLSLCFCCCGIVYVITSLRGVTKSFGIFIHFVFLVPLLVLMVSLPAADSVNLSPKVYLKLMPGAKTKQETLISQEIDFNLAVKNAKLFICID